MKGYGKETSEILWNICQICPRYEECPLFYTCEEIKEIGEKIENLCYDDTDLGVE